MIRIQTKSYGVDFAKYFGRPKMAQRCTGVPDPGQQARRVGRCAFPRSPPLVLRRGLPGSFRARSALLLPRPILRGSLLPPPSLTLPMRPDSEISPQPFAFSASPLRVRTLFWSSESPPSFFFPFHARLPGCQSRLNDSASTEIVQFGVQII